MRSNSSNTPNNNRRSSAQQTALGRRHLLSLHRRRFIDRRKLADRHNEHLRRSRQLERRTTCGARKTSIACLVSVLYSNPSFQVALLPSRVSGPEEPTNKLNKTAVERSIFKTVFPSSNHVDPDRIKAKIRWLKDLYTKQKKKLSLTGAGFLEGMDASDPVSASSIAVLVSKCTDIHHILIHFYRPMSLAPRLLLSTRGSPS